MQTTRLSYSSILPRFFPSKGRISSARFLSSNPPSGKDPPPISANVIQGPSLLQTSVARPSPSLMFLPGLRSLPFWSRYDAKSDTNRIAYQDPTLTKVVQHLEANVDLIREEYNRVASTLVSDYKHDAANEHSLHQGSWDWHSYLSKGQMQGHFGQYFPNTTRVLQELRQAPDTGLPTLCLLEDIPFGYGFFSTLHPHSSIKAHCSPMNFRWRIHLPLEIPDDADQLQSKCMGEGTDNTQQLPRCGIRVGQQVQTWTNGKALVLDDSYEHMVWNDTDSKRVLFLLDIWHPDISLKERKDIIGMFQYSQKQGWYNNPSQQKIADPKTVDPARLNLK